MNFAFLIIDMQKDFFTKKELSDQKQQLITNINDLINFLHPKHIPIIWIRQVLKKDLSNSPKHIQKSGKGVVLEDTQGAELIQGLSKSEQDYEIIKTRYSSFFNTSLDDLLKELKVDSLIISGINTHACIRVTAIDAYQRDLNVIIAKDCVSSYDKQHHQITMNYFEPVIATVKTNQQIKESLS